MAPSFVEHLGAPVADDKQVCAEPRNRPAGFTGPISATSGIVQTIAGLDEMAAAITDLSIDVVLADEVTFFHESSVKFKDVPEFAKKDGVPVPLAVFGPGWLALPTLFGL